MGILKRITEKPWLDQDDRVVKLHTASFKVHNRKVALIVFLCVVGSVFFLLLAATHIRIALATDWVPLDEPMLLWFNTLVLIAVSVALEGARHAINNQRDESAFLYFLVSGSLTLLFIVLQAIVWFDLIVLGYAAQRNPANAFFYVLTALHIGHLLGGLVAWVRALARIRSHKAEYSHVRLGIELCAIYWHFLLFVWIIILALFIST